MTDHPLTVEICEELSSWYLYKLDPLDADDHRKDMRAAYDKGIQACIDWLHDYPWRGRTVQGIAEDMEEELLAHKGMVQLDQPNKEDS